MSTLKKSDKLTIAALVIGVIAGLGVRFYFDASATFSFFVGFIVAAGSLKGLQDSMAANSIINSKAINKD